MPLTESNHLPGSTYRVQLHGGFGFAKLADLLPYFARLGITDLYLSPIFTATPGSLHGYDVTDYGHVNPELGGADGFDLLAARVRREGMGMLIDFVPNHMGIAGALNRWWRDVLENGRRSPYSPFFDIQWRIEPGGDHPRVLVPVLEDHYGRMLETGRISLTCTDELLLAYGDLTLPLSPSSYAWLLSSLQLATRDDQAALTALAEGFNALPKPDAATDPEAARRRVDEVERLKREFAAMLAARPQVLDALNARLRGINGTPGVPASFDTLHELIERQHYRLARWKTGAHEINYRRFFAIDTLVGLQMENTEVFRESHELLARLIREGKVSGLRIDHIDGLRQPADYLRRLQSLARPDASRPLYVLVEKILCGEEPLPDAWPVHGTTGYDFIREVACLFVDPSEEARFDDVYRRFTGETEPYADVVYAKKRLIIAEMFVNAVSNLGAELVEILSPDRRWRDLTRHELTTAVSELMANFPVYRTYRNSQQPSPPQDRRMLTEACARALARNPRADREPFEFVRDLLTGDYPPPDAAEELRRNLLSWVLTFQQYTGAVMAKSVEDTAYYTYSRLIALNEVGGSPEVFGRPPAEFHRACAGRLADRPCSMLTTSTHDTKLSEDVRARLYALSELGDEWENWLREWQGLTVRHTTAINGAAAPDALDQYRFFQVLLGAWPLDESAVDDTFRARLKEHFRKAVSEAKRHTSILQANEPYFAAFDRYVDGAVNPETAAEFLQSFIPRATRIARIGMVNSLAQTVLKCTVPGVPDFYQGNESWDFSLVDPDNRRDVDFERLGALLGRVSERQPSELFESWRDGGIKLRLVQILLRHRSVHPELYARGACRPVPAEGVFRDNVVSFKRDDSRSAILVAVPRLTAKLGTPPLGLCWDDTRILPGTERNGWRDLLADREFPGDEPIPLRTLFSDVPFAFLEAVRPRSRPIPRPNTRPRR